MKRIVLLVCVLAMLVLAGCGSDAALTEKDISLTVNGAEVTTQSDVTEKDISLTVNGAEVTTQSDVTELLEAFGADYAYAEAVSCVYDGMDKSYTYAEFTVYTYPSEQGDQLMEIYCTGGDVTTAKGISIGAPVKLVTELYGKNYAEKGATIVYELPLTQADCVPASVYFLIENDSVSAIGMTTEHRME